MMAFIAGLLLLFAAALGGIFAEWSNNVRHWLPRELDYEVVAFLCGFLGVYWLGQRFIERLADFIGWLKGPTPLERSREKIRAIEERQKACAKELGARASSVVAACG